MLGNDRGELGSAGLPVGVQLIGPMFEDRTPLRLAELLEQKIGGFQAASGPAPLRPTALVAGRIDDANRG